MGRSFVTEDLVSEILRVSFDKPERVPSLLGEKVTRHAALRSPARREIADAVYQALRWRRRLWGDSAPDPFSYADLKQELETIERLSTAPPLEQWRTLDAETLARELSFPTWIAREWISHFGAESAVRLMLASNQPAPTTIRVNLLKTDRSTLKQFLGREGVETREGQNSPWALHLLGRRNVRGTDAFRKGFFEIQDEGSQVLALATGARPGQLVVDACAGAGGKTLALAAMMENRGRLLALDSDSRWFAELERRAKRCGVTVLETRWVAADDPEPASDLAGAADLALVDAPCSGTGTLRRHPWRKWALHCDEIREYARRQVALLARYARLVKPGGRLVYATCSLLSEENEGVAKEFVSRHADSYTLIMQRCLRPDVEGTDGFYFAAFECRSETRRTS